MELRHLRYFVAAAEAENVSRAATRLHVSQPALSRQIRDLEDELGFPLFERGAKSVRLTQAGKAFLTDAQAILVQSEKAVSSARSIAAGENAEVNVGYAPSPTVRLLPRVLRNLQAAAPKLKVRLHDLSTEEMLSGIRGHQLQLAFMVGPGKAMLRGLKFEELGRDEMCVAMPVDHRWSKAKAVTTAELTNEPLLVFSAKEYPEYIEYVQELFAGQKKKPLFAGEHDSATSLVTAIESGAGIAIVPQSFSCFTGPRLKLLPIKPTPPPLIIGAVWLQGADNTLIETVLQEARKAAQTI